MSVGFNEYGFLHEIQHW